MPALADGPTTQFTVGGQVAATRVFRLQDLQALPAQTQIDSFLSGTSSTTATFTGPTLWSLLNDTVGLRTDPNTRNDVLRNIVTATGSDGYQAVYALGELNPSFGGSTARPELVAYANTPNQLLTTDGFARTTEPGDIRGGRYVSNLVSITVLHAPRMTGTFAGGLSTQFTVTGQVSADATFNLARLTALGATTVTAPASGTSPAATFTGVPLWTLLQNVGVVTNPSVRNNILRDAVIATGSDGYQAVISLGEINPDFGGNTANPILVAYSMNGGAPGASLGTNGFARLVVPDDNLRGRWVSNLINLELFDVSNWKVLSGESLDIAGFSYRTLGFTLAGGTLTNSLGSATLTAPSYLLQGGLIDTNVTLGGTGALTQASGTTILRGTVATPNVAINGGTLQLGGDGRLASATLLTMGGGTLDLNGYAQSVGTLNGTGTISLSRAASAGVLSVGAGSFAGSIVDGPRAGTLIKTGEGTLTLSGSSTLSGPTSVQQGSLVVNGSLANSAVMVESGGKVGGVGRLGNLSVNAGGTVAPGNSIGTLNVAGNAAFAPGSLFAVKAAADGRSDRIAATGAARIAGGTVSVSLENAAAPLSVTEARGLLGQRYTILTAAGGVTGRFDLVGPNYTFIGTSLAYGATTVDLAVVRNGTSFASVGATRNQAAVGSGIEGLGAGNRLYETILVTSDPATARGTFQALTGDIHASTVSAEFETAFFVREAILDRLRWGTTPGAADLFSFGRLPATYTADLPGRAAPAVPVAVQVVDPRVFGLWGQAFGAFGNARSDGNATSLNRQIAGFVIGADVRLENGIKLGAAGGYTETTIDTLGRLQSATISSPFGAVYGGYEAGPFALRLGAVYADNAGRTRRTVAFVGLTDVDTSRPGGSTVQGFGELGYRVFLDGAAAPGFAPGLGKGAPGSALAYVEPFVGGAYVGIHRDRFVEGGGVAALTGFSRDYDLGAATAGLRGQTAIDLGLGAPLSAHGLIGYRRAFGDVVPTALLAFGSGTATGSGFLTAGIPIDRNAVVAEAGLDLRVAANATIGVAYTGQVGERAQDNAVKGNFTYRW